MIHYYNMNNTYTHKYTIEKSMLSTAHQQYVSMHYVELYVYLGRTGRLFLLHAHTVYLL